MTREDYIKDMDGSNWDVIIIGGGITGAGILRESVRRGLKAVLLEQKDFAWGTSSRSTKMVHGGMRYLREGNFALTRESVLERENLIKELPGLVENKSFVLPFYKGKLFKQLILHFGLIIYDLLSGKWRKHVYSVKEMQQRAPLVSPANLKGGFVINDAVTDDARLVLRVLNEAKKNGGRAVNYCKVTQLVKKDGIVRGVQFQDMVSGNCYEASSRIVINATGAWVDELRKQVQKTNNNHIRPLRGSHIILSSKRLPLVDNVSIIHPQDERPVIALAWEGRILMGTTDLDHEYNLEDEATTSQTEVSYLLAALNYQFSGLNFTEDDIISTMAGIRPVIDTSKANPSQESRDHAIWLEQGLLTVTGGKLTTFRAVALDSLKKAQEILGSLPDLNIKQKIFDEALAPSSLDENDLQPGIAERLLGRYGNEASRLLAETSAEDLEPIPDTHTIWAELRWAVTNEMVVHLDDLLLRRTRIGLLLKEGGIKYLARVRQICQPILGWSDQNWEQEENRYLKIWKTHYSVPGHKSFRSLPQQS